jgi:hypothetical protein
VEEQRKLGGETGEELKKKQKRETKGETVILRLQQQLQSSIFSSHCTRNRALQERNTGMNWGRERTNKGRTVQGEHEQRYKHRKRKKT